MSTVSRPGYEYIGHTERNARGQPTSYAIEVPEEHATAWLAHVRKRMSDAWCQATWTANQTVMGYYDGTPDASITRNPFKV